MIRLVVFDIDGVLTDAAIIVDSCGQEQKRISLRDIDAIFELKKRGFLIAAVTGETTDIVQYFKHRFPWDCFLSGEKHKIAVIKKLEQKFKIDKEDICYIGDGKYDVQTIAYVGLGICPDDAIEDVKQAADMILNKNGGNGCVWELLRILEQYNSGDSSKTYLYHRLVEHTDMFKRIASDEEITRNLMQCAKKIIDIYKKGGKIFLCGNGGSAADAQHIATEFVSRFYKERPGLNAEALTVNTSMITAIGNDYNFENIFVRQLEAKSDENDMLIGLSTSGRSKNVIEAVKYAKRNKLYTALFMGDYITTELEGYADYLIRVPSKITPRIQEAHIFLGHVMAEYVEHMLFP